MSLKASLFPGNVASLGPLSLESLPIDSKGPRTILAALLAYQPPLVSS